MLSRLATLETMPDSAMLVRAESHFRLMMATWPDSIEAQRMKHGMLDGLKGMAPPGMPSRPEKTSGKMPEKTSEKTSGKK